MRCLVTGASGHLGSAVVRMLLARGHEVVGMLRDGSDPWRLRDVLTDMEVLRGDLADPGSLKRVARNARADAMLHLGWAGTTASERNDPALVAANTRGSECLIAATTSAGCAHVVGVGSQAEYGAVDDLLDERTPTRPDTPYGEAKIAVSHRGQELCDAAGARFAWIRLVATYGPCDDARHLIPSVINSLLAGREPELTSGRQRWDYLYVDDASEALVLTAESDASGFFVLGSGRAASVRELVERIRDSIDPSLELGFGRLPDPERQLLLANPARLRAAIGWWPRTSLDRGLERTIAWHRAQLAPAGKS